MSSGENFIQSESVNQSSTWRVIDRNSLIVYFIRLIAVWKLPLQSYYISWIPKGPEIVLKHVNVNESCDVINRWTATISDMSRGTDYKIECAPGAQRRLGSACASAQSEQSSQGTLWVAKVFRVLRWTAKTLISIRTRIRTVWSES